ncbi:MAG: hypothetical protein Q4A74_05005 [Cardiobacteriaceae bacterium]|nr:hypothetical protein [Cardiobacteriaceae bacterium]
MNLFIHLEAFYLGIKYLITVLLAPYHRTPIIGLLHANDILKQRQQLIQEVKKQNQSSH